MGIQMQLTLRIKIKNWENDHSFGKLEIKIAGQNEIIIGRYQIL